MKNGILFLLLICLLAGCQPEGRIYVEHKELSPNIEWLKEDVREFNVPIESTDQLYDVSLAFRYANGYRYEVVKVEVTEISPGGEESVNEYELKVRDEQGEYIGEAGYDIWDSEHLVQEKKQYPETGIYTYRIQHIMPQDPLNYAMEIGLILDQSK